MFGMGGWEIMMILLFVLIFFGSKSMPKMARMLGRGMRQIQDATQEIQRDIQNSVNSTEGGLGKVAKDISKPFEEMEKPLSDVGKTVGKSVKEIEK